MCDVVAIVPRVRRRNVDSEFFVEGNYERYLAYIALRPTQSRFLDFEEFDFELPFVCVEVGCNERFRSFINYEEHKFRSHSHQCSVCGKSYTSERLLSFHISELHDNYFLALAKRKPSYCCLVLGCEGVFWSHADRRAHMIAEHKYHPSYDFHNPKKYLQAYRKKKDQKGSENQQGMEISQSDGPTAPFALDSAMVDATVSSISTIGAAPKTGNRAQRRAEKKQQYESTTGNVCTLSTGQVQHPSSLMAIAGREEPRGAPVQQAAIDTVSDSVGAGGAVEEMVVAEDACMADLTEGLRSISMKVPSKISFGRRKRHGVS